MNWEEKSRILVVRFSGRFVTPMIPEGRESSEAPIGSRNRISFYLRPRKVSNVREKLCIAKHCHEQQGQSA